jgi:DNA topoisomerase-2
MTKTNTKTVEARFKKLDEISHVLLRPGRYIGSINPHTATTWVVGKKPRNPEEPLDAVECMVQQEITWCPALLKIFDEIISNSVDFSKTAEGKHVTTVKAEINKETGELSVYDDGGIIVKKHAEYDQYVPEMIFELRSGSNFDDDDDSVLTGQNGEGAALTSIFSTSFNVETCDGNKKFVQTHLENSRKKTEPKVTDSTKHYTKITFTPDYAKFGLNGLDEGNYQRLVKRVYDVAGCNPRLKVYLNGHQIKIKSFEDYIRLHTDEFVFDENEHWKIGVAHSNDGFKHISFVNGTETLIGGNHISYISDQITDRLREYFKKKHKVEVKPSDIRQHLLLFIDATIIKPRYSSQSKEDLITEKRDFGTTFEISDKMISKLVKSPVIQSVLDWVQAKEDAAKRAEERKLNKDLDKANLRKITKFTDATEKNRRDQCMLFICEGDTIHEDETLLVYRNEALEEDKISNVKIGEKVLTHKSRLREVIGKSRKVIEGIKISAGNISHIVSKKHRLVVYDKVDKKIIEVQAQDLEKGRHCLVRSRLIDIDHLDKLHSITKINHETYDVRILTCGGIEIDSSLSHKFYTWDENQGAFTLKMASELDINFDYLVMKMIE